MIIDIEIRPASYRVLATSARAAIFRGASGSALVRDVCVPGCGCCGCSAFCERATALRVKSPVNCLGTHTALRYSVIREAVRELGTVRYLREQELDDVAGSGSGPRGVRSPRSARGKGGEQERTDATGESRCTM
eukprot:2640274-Prymnesium_polylepis.2